MRAVRAPNTSDASRCYDDTNHDCLLSDCNVFVILFVLTLLMLINQKKQTRLSMMFALVVFLKKTKK